MRWRKGGFDNTKVRKILESKGINFRKSMPYTSEQNGAAEKIESWLKAATP